MKTMTDFSIILRSLKARLFSTTVTIVMVAVSVGLMLVLLGMTDASQRAFERGAGDMHLIVSRDDSPMVAVLNGVYYANPPRRPIEWATYERITNSLPLMYGIATQQGDSYAGFPVLATQTTFFSDFKPAYNEQWSFAEGRPFETTFEVVLGATTAARTKLSIGDRIPLTHGIARSKSSLLGGGESADDGKPHVHREFEYEVVGILDATGGPHDRALFTDLISTWIIHAHDRRLRDDPSITDTTEADLLEIDRLITGILLRVPVRDQSQMSGMLQQAFDQLRRDPSITVARPDQQVSALFRVIGGLDDLFVAMAFVVMVSSAIAIMLALYNSMWQRRRQIAVLRVLGCTRGRVFGLIVTESAMLGMAGALLGVLVALVGGALMAEAIRSQLHLVVEPSLPPKTLLGVTLVTTFLAAAAGVVPAIMAYRTDVVHHLRHRDT